MNIVKKYKSYSPIVFSILLVAGMCIIMIFENLGLAKKEANLNSRYYNTIENANKRIEISTKSKSLNIDLYYNNKPNYMNKYNIIYPNNISKIKNKIIIVDTTKENEKLSKITNILIDSIQEYLE